MLQLQMFNTAGVTLIGVLLIDATIKVTGRLGEGRDWGWSWGEQLALDPTLLGPKEPTRPQLVFIVKVCQQA